MISVVVVDDGSVAIRGAVDVLRESSLHALLGVYPSAGSAFGDRGPTDRTGASPPVLLIDPFHPGGEPDALSILTGWAAVLIMSAGTRPDLIRRALLAGVRGFIGKEIVVSTLLAAVSAVGVGGTYLDGSLTDVLLPCPDTRPLAGPAATVGLLTTPAVPGPELTPRERDVLVMVAQGLTHKQIGTRLQLSKATVDTYVHRVRQKVGSVNKAGLTRVAIGLNLLAD